MQLDPHTPLVGGDSFGVPGAGFLQIDVFLKRSGNAEFCGKRMRNEECLKTASSRKFLTLFWANSLLSGSKLEGRKKKALAIPWLCRMVGQAGVMFTWTYLD